MCPVIFCGCLCLVLNFGRCYAIVSYREMLLAWKMLLPYDIVADVIALADMVLSYDIVVDVLTTEDDVTSSI